MTVEVNLGDGWQTIGPLAYQGKAGCESTTCRRFYDPRSATFARDCQGWHCSYCDEPCSYNGHGCDAAKAILGAAWVAAVETGGTGA